MIWIVEEYDDYVKDLVTEIKRQGHQVDFINYYKMLQDSNYNGVGLPKGTGNWDIHECVLFYGSIQTGLYLQRHRHWIPNIWYTQENYRCTHYYARLGEHLLNQDYIMLPRAEVGRRKNELYDIYGVDDCIYIRPNTGNKSFGGKIFELERWQRDWSWVEQFTDPEDLVIVSSPKKIGKEWRFVIADDVIITGSQYKDSGSCEIEVGYPLQAKQKCQDVLNTTIEARFKPDEMYTIDICESGGEFHLMEINCFCCSGLYAGDLTTVVAKASELAIREHKNYYAEMVPT